MEIVTVVNRTSQPVEGIFDGKRTVIAPHARLPMLYHAAEHLKRQNPVMGTEDISDPRSPEFLVGIEEWGDDISPIEQSDKQERFDRTTVGDGGSGAVEMNLRPKGKPSRVKVAIDDDNPVGIQLS